ncbi:site-specific DNA-methyltransferase [Flavobacterium soyangense]|uniref:site-specific DNA-methyltransferase (adenine-specific) n=1 Tax=Flavobacterium soyangense TaxID=2023265 RepID=A0A930Y1F6_9FLAO|nr:site-specific DNA-methyltransferase [Flavobacterium soyangense]MBF2709429.1 site-specific DNA-methyltransferase [Flavobacterium soyangense]
MPTLNWIGKEKVINHHQDVPYKILEPLYNYELGVMNYELDATLNSGNKIIHGDNLEALKSLLPEYEGKIKCIYIDPPYNTGNESWVYNDNVNHPKIKKWLGEVVGKDGEDLTRHDKWLCMMYPRLKLLHKLLSNDGVIFISIDDNEQANLKLICDEIFGARNYLGLISRKQSSGSKNDMGNSKVITTADYILPYKKNDFEFLPYQIKNNKKFNLKDEIGFYSIRALEMQGGGDTLPQRSKMGYSIYHRKADNQIKLLFDYNLENEIVYEEENKELLSLGFICYRPRKRDMALGRWRWGDGTFIERFNNNQVYFDKGRVYMKERASDVVNKYPEALIEDYLNTQGTNELKEIFYSKTFDFPKPSELLKFIFTVSTDKNSIILDSFAGSGTTAHAVLNLNKQDGGNRKYILIEMEDYADTITAERVKRVVMGYGNSETSITGLKTEGTGGSFNYYQLGEPLFLEEDVLNEAVGLENILKYIWYSETRTSYSPTKPSLVEENYHIGTKDQTDYYFYYTKDAVTTVDYDFMAKIKHKASQYIIYADNCLLEKDFMLKHHIIFKKIPRDITRF